MAPHYTLRYFFDWGVKTCLWAGDTPTLDRFGFGGVNLNHLPLSNTTKHRAEELATWHDQSLNQEYPPNPSPWCADDRGRFDAASQHLLQSIREDLGPDFTVVDEQRPMSEESRLNNPDGFHKS